MASAFRRATINLIGAFITLAANQCAHAVTIDTVLIGNPGNPADTRYFIDAFHQNGVGSVGQSFNMGKTEITNAQYVEFLNAVAADDPYGLYNENMGITGSAGGIQQYGSTPNYTYYIKPPPLGRSYSYNNKPVVFVSSADAMRFANWLHNGQPTGAEDPTTTEDGAYTLNGAVTDDALAAITRNPGARWWLPNEDEWCKAAYYDPASESYYDYPTGTNAVPNNNRPSNDTGNSANISGDPCPGCDVAYPFTDAGAYALSRSPYGTFDQGGNALEWTETLATTPPTNYRVLRGGSFNDLYYYLHAGRPFYSYKPTYEDGGSGANSFRVASSVVPEPGTALLLVTGLCATGGWRCLRRSKTVHGYP
jgi:formylglycine-generating enzyme required for sulfatase activity